MNYALTVKWGKILGFLVVRKKLYNFCNFTATLVDFQGEKGPFLLYHTGTIGYSPVNHESTILHTSRYIEPSKDFLM